MAEANYFPFPAAFRSWLEKNHKTADELLVGFHKRGTGKPSMTWPQSVDQALCFGWIDGVRKSVDDQRYTIRFTPRRPGSNWSTVNIKRVPELEKEGLMRPAGRAAFKQRPTKKEKYSYETRHTIKLDAALAKRFKANQPAWAFFQEQPPSYRKLVFFWIMSGKKEETRLKRLARLIDTSANRRRVV